MGRRGLWDRVLRLVVATGSLVVLSTGAAVAQKEPFKAAPVPGNDPGAVTPADRAGRSDTVDNSAPFAAAPTGAIAGTGQATPQTLSSTQKEAPPMPSLSR